MKMSTNEKTLMLGLCVGLRSGLRANIRYSIRERLTEEQQLLDLCKHKSRLERSRKRLKGKDSEKFAVDLRNYRSQYMDSIESNKISHEDLQKIKSEIPPELMTVANIAAGQIGKKMLNMKGQLAIKHPTPFPQTHCERVKRLAEIRNERNRRVKRESWQ